VTASDAAVDAVRITEDGYRLIEELSVLARGRVIKDSMFRLAMKATTARARARDHAFDSGALPDWQADPAGTPAPGRVPPRPWSDEQRRAVLAEAGRVSDEAERAQRAWSRGHGVREALRTVSALMERLVGVLGRWELRG
jgi:hypothetical protein